MLSPTATASVPSLPVCPHCHSNKRQHRAGRTKYRSPRFHCTACDKDYTPAPKIPGYPSALRQQAVALHLEGLSLRAIARTVGVNPQSVANWVAAQQSALQRSGQTTFPAPLPISETVELDEVQVFVGARKGEKNAGYTSRRQ